MDWAGRTRFADRYIVFNGSSGDNSYHSHIALQIVFGASARIELEDGGAVEGSQLYIRPHIRHRLLPLSSGRIYLLEPSSRLGAHLLGLCGSEPAGRFMGESDSVEAAASAFAGEVTDRRLERAMALLEQPGAFDLSLDDVARRVGISQQRLRALAAHQLGMPLSRWRLWSALRRAGLAVAQGTSLAEAAIAAGFSDQAHYSRTMRAMLGITPGSSRKVLASG